MDNAITNPLILSLSKDVSASAHASDTHFDLPSSRVHGSDTPFDKLRVSGSKITQLARRSFTRSLGANGKRENLLILRSNSC